MILKDILTSFPACSERKNSSEVYGYTQLPILQDWQSVQWKSPIEFVHSHIKVLPINWIWKFKWSFLAVIRMEESPMVSVLGAAVPFLPAPGASRGGVTWDGINDRGPNSKLTSNILPLSSTGLKVIRRIL